MRRVIPPNRNSEPKVKRKAEPKLSIQLVPATQQLEEQLNPIRNPRREITIKPKKDITYLKDYLFKTYGVFKGAFLKLIANNREWSSLETPNTTLGEIYMALGLNHPDYFRLSYSFLFKIQMIGESNERFEISIEQEKTLGDLTRTVEGRLDPFLPYIVLLKTEHGWEDFSYSTMTIAELAEQLGENLVLSFKKELINPTDWSDPLYSGEFSFDLDDFSKKKCRSEGCDSIGLFLCGNCKNTLYCSESCQKSHWRKEHKTKCIQSSISNPSSASASFSSSSSGMGTQGILRGIKTKGF
jgi:AraC-like DNA-binding protein